MIKTMDEPEERLDLVDSDDNPVGTIAREEILSLEKDRRGFARAVGIFIINSQGELWIPKRQMHKKIAPGGLDFSAGEHVGCGELYETAALRGLQEELSITPDTSKLHLVGSVRPFTGMPYFHKIFTYHTDTVPAYNQKDYSAYEWLNPEQVVAKLNNGEPSKEILLPSIKLLMKSDINLGVTK